MLKPFNSVKKMLMLAFVACGFAFSPLSASAAPAPASQQESKTASGHVKDELGEPFIGTLTLATSTLTHMLNHM